MTITLKLQLKESFHKYKDDDNNLNHFKIDLSFTEIIKRNNNLVHGKGEYLK